MIRIKSMPYQVVDSSQTTLALRLQQAQRAVSRYSCYAENVYVSSHILLSEVGC
jgi:hypothetical protein